MSLADKSIPTEVLAEAENMLSGNFQLNVPEGTVRKNTHYARWNETVVIESAHYEQKEGRDGQQRYQFVFKYTVISPGANIGRGFTEFMLYNFGALAGNSEAVGNGSMEGEKKMSTMTAGKMKQLAVAAGLNLENGLDGEAMEILFPSLDEIPEEPFLVGQKFNFTYLDNSDPKRQYNGKNSQNIDSITPFEDEEGDE